MKRIIDFIGDAIVELMILSLYVLLPLAKLYGLIKRKTQKA